MKKTIHIIVLLIFFISCKTEEKSGYNCNNGTCSAVFENPQYLTLSDCQSACSNNVSGYNCVSGSCVSVSSNAQYTTLSSCQSSCVNNTSGYNCVNSICQSVSSNAQYSTLSACQSDCITNPNVGALKFQIYQKCPGYAVQIRNGANVKIYSSKNDFDYDNLFLIQMSQIDGSTTFNNLNPKTYYYKVLGEIYYGNCNEPLIIETGVTSVTANKTTIVNVTLEK